MRKLIFLTFLILLFAGAKVSTRTTPQESHSSVDVMHLDSLTKAADKLEVATNKLNKTLSK